MKKEYMIPYNQINKAKGALNEDFRRSRVVEGIYCNVVGNAGVEVYSADMIINGKREYIGKIIIRGLEKEIKRIKNALKRGKIDIYSLN